MIQIDLEFSPRESPKTTQAAEHKRKQIKKLLSLLCSKQKSLQTTLTSFTHLVGDPVCRGNKGKKEKNVISASNSSDSTFNESPTDE